MIEIKTHEGIKIHFPEKTVIVDRSFKGDISVRVEAEASKGSVSAKELFTEPTFHYCKDEQPQEDEHVLLFTDEENTLTARWRDGEWQTIPYHIPLDFSSYGVPLVWMAIPDFKHK